MKSIFKLLVSFFILSNLFAQNSLNFSSLKSYKCNASFSFASGTYDAYLVLLSNGVISAMPTDGQEYGIGSKIGSAKVVYIGSGTFVPLKNLLQNTTYYISVIPFNNNFSIDYDTNNTIEETFTSAEASFNDYYASIDFTSNQMLTQLTQLIQPQLDPNTNLPIVPYAQFDETIVKDIFEIDTTINNSLQHYVICQYSSEKRPYSGVFEYVTPTPQYSREHRVAKSWYDFTNLGQAILDVPEGADMHLLDLVQNDVNTSRSNLPFGEVTSNPWSNSYLEYVIGRDHRNIIVTEPRNDRKGDVARAHFYTMLAYNGKYGENWGLDNLLTNAQDQELQVFLDWHNQDPVDDFEKTRNQYVYEKQGNRNPFIDFPQLVDCINFSNITKIDSCNVNVAIANKNAIQMEAFVYPNPSTGILHIDKKNIKKIDEIALYNILGAKQKINFTKSHTLNLDSLAAGTYVLKIVSKGKSYLSKVVLK